MRRRKAVKRRKADVLADPELVELLGRDPELLAIADAISETQSPERPSRRRNLLIAAAVAAAILLVALPAIAAFTPLIDFSTAPKAEGPVVRDFKDLQQQAPPGMDPRVIAGETRRLDLPLSGTGKAVIYVAPTRTGGFCIAIIGHTLGCDPTRSVPAEIGFSAPRLDRGAAIVYGWFYDPDASSATVTTAQGSKHTMQLVRISQPIDASVFVARIDDITDALPIRVTVTNAAGETIAAKTIEEPPK
jgi:hypothetical protein